jgi:putative component of membrane protein insertase Oxa1/YidC/SpoIIIJ protein YidD
MPMKSVRPALRLRADPARLDYDLANPMDAITFISWYQRRLSPLKGFSCPRRRLHGHDSCSQYAKRVIARFGLSRGLRLLRRRFADCHHAAQILNYQNPKSSEDRPRDAGSCPCNFTAAQGSDGCFDLQDKCTLPDTDCAQRACAETGTDCLMRLACDAIVGGCF